MSLKELVINNLNERRDRILRGDINCIPSPFQRFSDDLIGIEQSTYYTITSFTKGSKSQFTSYYFIFKPLLYIYYNKPNIKLTIFYFPLEETQERITQRFISFLLYEFTNGDIRISPRDLRSTTKALDSEVLEVINLPEIQNILDFFEKNIIFSTESNPTGIYKFCKSYAENNGTTFTKTIHIKDEFGIPQEREIFDYYIPNDPNEYKLIIIDTINLIDGEKGLNTKQSIDKLSEYLAKHLRNRYGFSPVVIHQQAFDSEGIENIKLNKVRPSVAGLGDSKYTSRDSNIVLGLFSPMRFELKEYLGYDITKFKDAIRFLEVIVNRDGEMGGIIALYFDGAVSSYRELPLPSDSNGLNKVYNFMYHNRLKGRKVDYSKYLNK